MDNDGPLMSNKYSRSHSESSSQSQHDNQLVSRKSKKPPPLLPKKQQTKNSSKKSNKFDNSNDQWENWNESPIDNRHRQQLHSDELSTQKPNRYNKQIRHNDRQQQPNSRSKPTSTLSNKINQLTNNKTQPAWRPLSPTRQSESIDPTQQESISYKSQQRTNLNDHKQRYQTTNTSIINTASIPPLMSVRSDPTTTAKLYKTVNHTGSSDYYDDENVYYDSNLQTHQRYNPRGYTTLGSYGRYRRSGTLRHQQQYTTYNINNTSGISSAPNTASGTRQKKNLSNRIATNNKKSNQSSEQTKTSAVDESNTSIVKNQSTSEEVPITKSIETSILSPTIEIENSNQSETGISDQKTLLKTENESSVISHTEIQSNKTNKKTPSTTSNSKRRTNKDQQNYQQDQRYQNQQAPRHRNNYSRSMQGIFKNFFLNLFIT